MTSFHDLNLSPLLMTAIDELGYKQPSPIQAEALPILLGEPTDFLGLAATGTGKTAAFSIPMLERIDPANRTVQAVVLCPTRELAVQVCGQINLLAKHLGVKAIPIYGGSSFGDQAYGLKRGAQIVVGTPGRMCDHLDRGTLKLSDIQVVILDEADEMISMGFKDDLERILSQAPRATAAEGEASSQIWLFSATMSPEVRRMADGYMNDPAFVQINRTEMLPENIEQIYYRAHEGDKPEILCKLIEAADEFYGLVFCQTKALVVDLTRYLQGRGYTTDCLHGDMDQDARERTMKAFRSRDVKVLVCTDVASRGLDVKDVTHVVNYSLPRELDNYVHRIGRTARSGKKGVAMSLVTPSHRILVSRIERMTKSRMKEGRIPSRREVAAKKVEQTLKRFEAETLHSRAMEVISPEFLEKIASMAPGEIAGRFVAMMFSEIFSDRSAEDAPTQHNTNNNHPSRVSVVRPTSGSRPFVKPVVSPVSTPRAAAPVVKPQVVAATVAPVEAAAPALESPMMEDASAEEVVPAKVLKPLRASMVKSAAKATSKVDASPSDETTQPAGLTLSPDSLVSMEASEAAREAAEKKAAKAARKAKKTEEYAQRIAAEAAAREAQGGESVEAAPAESVELAGESESEASVVASPSQPTVKIRRAHQAVAGADAGGATLVKPLDAPAKRFGGGAGGGKFGGKPRGGFSKFGGKRSDSPQGSPYGAPRERDGGGAAGGMGGDPLGRERPWARGARYASPRGPKRDGAVGSSGRSFGGGAAAGNGSGEGGFGAPRYGAKPSYGSKPAFGGRKPAAKGGWGRSSDR